MKYLRIKETEIPISPFKKVKINAIQWVVTSLFRGAERVELVCSCVFLNEDIPVISEPYSYVLYVPKEVLDIWLDDSVIDDFIISESNGVFEKE